MTLAFLINEIQQRCCRLFQGAWTAAGSKACLWRKLRSRFALCLVPDCEMLLRSVMSIHAPAAPVRVSGPCVRTRRELLFGSSSP
ncbi:hypothetical protein [Thiohalocapsa sp.]|uniref:hypothetical protein n=1 Tax=Thiohalocapsa sp. TaxID=2497641 RepID=UPI0025F4B74A|nr:hypothetical protein [Thiohalocapsa sp.]